jgi:SAM-dependent methyltransferase
VSGGRGAATVTAREAASAAAPHAALADLVTAHARAPRGAAPLVGYARMREAWDELPVVATALAADARVRVLDVGGGANPLLPVDTVARLGLDYLVLDPVADELAKAPPAYRTLVGDACDRTLAARLAPVDLVVSRFVCEHIEHPAAFHATMRDVLAPGGIAVHFFPTLYALPFLVNRAIPEALADRLLDGIAPRDRAQHDKFRAWYRWCRGPTGRQLARLRGTGLELVAYRGYFGHAYFDRWPSLRRRQDALAARLVAAPRPWWTSYALVVLRRPAQ